MTITGPSPDNNMRAMTKSQLAKKAGVSSRTFYQWLQEPMLQAQLAPFKLKIKQKILPPGAVEIICKHYVIEID